MRVPYVPDSTLTIDAELPAGPGYVRWATVTHKDGEEYRCFTNPIWIRRDGPGMWQLRVTCVDW